MVKQEALIGGASIVVIPLLLLLSCLGAVEQNEYGLVYNWITKTISTEVYRGGTHFIGFWNAFVTFPATAQTVEFSSRIGLRTANALHTRTKEGLGLHLSISFQYKLDPEKIPELYALTNVQYEGLFTRIARDQLLEAASEYEGPQYWIERKNIGDHMRTLVDEQLSQNFASLWGLQLLVIDLPDRYEASITKTQVQHQTIQTNRNKQAAASIRADTKVLEAEYRRQIAVTQAEAQANYTKDVGMAKAEAALRKLNAEAKALGYVRKKLSLSPHDAVQYQELSAFNGLTNATFLANLPGISPMVNIGGVKAQAPRGLLQRGRATGAVSSVADKVNASRARAGGIPSQLSNVDVAGAAAAGATSKLWLAKDKVVNQHNATRQGDDSDVDYYFHEISGSNSA